MQTKTVINESRAAQGTATHVSRHTAAPRLGSPRKLRESVSRGLAVDSSFNSTPQAESWELGVVEDHRGRIHFGVVVDAENLRQRTFVDLLSPLGAAELGRRDLDQVITISRGKQLATLRQIAHRCIDEQVLRTRLLELVTFVEARTN